VSDGGSMDGTADLARHLGREATFPVTVTTGECGRGRQLNRGAAASRGATLLFLHADSRFGGPQALAAALDILNETMAVSGNELIAGRFSLRFAPPRPVSIPAILLLRKQGPPRPPGMHPRRPGIHAATHFLHGSGAI